MVGSALAGALDDDDFDLAGELLLAWPFLQADWDPCASFAFRVLTRVEDEVGVLPSLALDRTGYEQQPAESRSQYVAAVTYHTAYVMGLLCSVLLQHRGRPKRPPPVSIGSASLAEELLAGLAAEGRRAQWLQDFEALAHATQAAYAPFLLDIALRRAMRRIDFGAARRLLQRAIEAGVVLSPLCLQVAGILRRLADLSELTIKATSTSKAQE